MFRRERFKADVGANENKWLNIQGNHDFRICEITIWISLSIVALPK
jgi:hypothetical protein